MTPGQEPTTAPEPAAPAGAAGQGGAAPYLLGLRLAGRRVVVVGGGRVATRRVAALLDAGAVVTLVAPEATATLEGLAAAGRLEWLRRGYRGGDCDSCWLVHACTDDAEVNALVAADAEARHTWCVRADDALASAAWTPASGRVGPVSVGVHAGREPKRAAAVRDAIVEQLRAGSLAPPPPLPDPRRERRGRVILVGGGPGDPELITVRGRRLLAEADAVVVDRLAPLPLLDELPPTVEIVDAAKLPGGRQLTQERINSELVTRAQAGQVVVRLKGGDPFVFGRGLEEIEACLAAGVEVSVVPGVTSAVAVPGSMWLPVTHRGVSQQFTVVSGHLPPGHRNSTVAWSALAASGGTLVLLMAVENWPAIAAALLAGGREPGTPAACVQEGTTRGGRVVGGTLADLAAAMTAAAIRPPAVIVVGEAVAVGLAARERAGGPTGDDAARGAGSRYDRRSTSDG